MLNTGPTSRDLSSPAIVAFYHTTRYKPTERVSVTHADDTYETIAAAAFAHAARTPFIIDVDSDSPALVLSSVEIASV